MRVRGTREKEREKKYIKCKITVTVYIYTVTVARLDIYKVIQQLTHVFYAILCKFLNFLYFRHIDAIALSWYKQVR